MRGSVSQRLRAKFRNSLCSGILKNAEIDPPAPRELEEAREPDEEFVVRIQPAYGPNYWLSDRRLFMEDDSAIAELFRYEEIKEAHWMFRDLEERLIGVPDSAGDLKTKYFDRLEIELPTELSSWKASASPTRPR